MNAGGILVETVRLLAFAGAGAAFGFVYFRLLERTALLFGAGKGWRMPAALTLARLGAALVLFAGAAQFGAGALLAAFGGFLLARVIALRTRRENA